MAKITRFEDLKCWQSSRILTHSIFVACKKGELNRDFDLKSQIKRASLSSMNNIAEGFTRYHRKEFKRFLDISQSSASEVKSMLYLIEDLEYLDTTLLRDLHKKVDEVKTLTLAFIKYLDKDGSAST